ncbi:MAG: helix-turn-helix domain-containing protein [Acidobacteriota bacterium]|nr:helix-turn-helix domain-containing protein [Acidobacteriota bacterium]
MTYEMGQPECFTSMPKLAAAAGIKERQCYNVVAQLEQLGFIERPEIFNTPSKKGTVFRLFLSPRTQGEGSNRRYHIGGEGD